MGVTLVTGAASGMGEAAADLLCDRGDLLLLDINEQRLRSLADRLTSRSKIETLAVDLADPVFVKALIDALNHRPIDTLIHCAGLSPTMAAPAKILEVNLAATIRLVEAARSRMAAGGAAVLFASSAGHLIGNRFDEAISKARTPELVGSLLPLAESSGAAYSISKRGVQLLVKREAAAFGRNQARIVSVSPGVIDTPMGRAEMLQQPVMKQMVDNSPLGRAARAEEVAAVAVFLSSAAASFVTGIDVLVDGGSLASMAA